MVDTIKVWPREAPGSEGQTRKEASYLDEATGDQMLRNGSSRA